VGYVLGVSDAVHGSSGYKKTFGHNGDIYRGVGKVPDYDRIKSI